MPADQNLEAEKLRAHLLHLTTSCRTCCERPEDCPMEPLRKMSMSTREFWLECLGFSDLQYLSDYHTACAPSAADRVVLSAVLSPPPLKSLPAS